MFSAEENKDFLKFGDCVYLYSKTHIDLEKKALENSYPLDHYGHDQEAATLEGFLSAKG